MDHLRGDCASVLPKKLLKRSGTISATPLPVRPNALSAQPGWVEDLALV